ncbi:hypothetical protein Agub_g7023 [Astrephomene gubernaculifera]|uniref:Uncharacterized protein n=1 Tax=Astrephomene gubernaculifera TaxID=47775 RepID=A0AAD3DTL3_9CHLO|nr:hypothetical protein Agub_g7023 [Astrephomene gubernaculifera]
MEVPRRRGGAYEHRSVVGNILAPTSGIQGSADLRTTPSSRGAPPAATSRPPWATELDTAGPSDTPPAGCRRPSSASHQRGGQISQGNHEFSFQTPSVPSQPGSARAGQAAQLSSRSHQHLEDYAGSSYDTSWEPRSRQAAATAARPMSSGRAADPFHPHNNSSSTAPTDQLDLWAQEQHHSPNRANFHQHQAPEAQPWHDSHADGIYVHVDSHNATTSQSNTPPSRRASAAATSTAAPPRTVSANSNPTARSGSRDAGRLQPGDLSSADVGDLGARRPAARRGAPPPPQQQQPQGRTAAASRVTASPARSPSHQPQPSAAAAATSHHSSHAAAVPGRSASTPKPRPVVQPKRSTSITDNVRRDWVDIGSASDRATARPGSNGRNRGGGFGGGGGGGAGAGGSRWDADTDDGDRGSWLFVAADSQDQQQQPGQLEEPRGQPLGDHQQQPQHVPVAEPLRREHTDGEGTNSSSSRSRSSAPLRGAVVNGSNRTKGSTADDGLLSGGGGGGGGGGRHGGSSGAHATPATTLEATFTQAAAAAPHVASKAVTNGGGGGGGGSGEVSMGHGALLAGGELGVGCIGSGGGGGAVAARRKGAGSLSSGASQAEASRQIQALQDENARLRDQIAHLHRLLAVSPASTASPTSAAAGAAALPYTAAEGGSRQQRPSSAASACGAGGGEAGPSMAAAATAGVALQQYKSQVIQLQRQVALMSREMEAKSRLAMEAEGVLLEAASRLTELASCAAADAGGATAASASGDGWGGGVGDAEQPPLSRERLLAVAKWSRQMLGRLRSEKSQSSKLFTQQDRDNPGGFAPSFAPSWSDSNTNSHAHNGNINNPAAAHGPSWHVPFIPAGGNRFLLLDPSPQNSGGGRDDSTSSDPSTGTRPSMLPSVAALCNGGGVFLADPVLAHRLEVAVAALAPRLAALAVAVRVLLLPAMPWLGLEAADRMQAEVGEVAASAAQVSEALSQLAALLPAGAVAFGDTPVSGEPRRRAAEVEAGRDSWLYGSPESLEAEEVQPAVANEDGTINVARLQAAIAPLLRDRKAGPKALADILEPMRARAQAVAAKRAVLESELRFASRASALHAEHVSHLMLSVGMAVREVAAAEGGGGGAAGGGGGSSKQQGIRTAFAAAAAVRQVLGAVDALEVHPCEACLKALVDVIRCQREHLDRVPELLVESPAADLEGRLLDKVEELHQGFKKALSRLEAHKRRQMDAGGLVPCSPGEGDGAGYEDEGEEEEGWRGEAAATNTGGTASGESTLPHQQQQRQQGQVRRGMGSGGSSNAGSSQSGRPPLPPSQQQQQLQQRAGAGSGKPPKPKPEWQE